MGRKLKIKFKFSTFVYLALIAAFAYSIYKYRGQLVDIFSVLQQGVWYWVLATVGVLAIAIYNQATWYSSIYQVLDLPSATRDLLPLYLIRRFVVVAAPSGGFAGWVPFLQFAKRRDLSVGVVFVANLVYTILWYTVFFLFLLVGLIFLFFAHDLQWFEISAALVMLVADLVMIIALVLAWFAPQLLYKALELLSKALEKVFSWIKRAPPITHQQFMTFASDLDNGVSLMRKARMRALLSPILHAFLNETLNLLMFFVSALAFGVQLNFAVVVAAYSISVLFFVVSPTPGGLGFVEGTLILVLTTLGIRADSATVITLAYRGISFWFPFILGFLALRWFRRHPRIGKHLDEPDVDSESTSFTTTSVQPDDV